MPQELDFCLLDKASKSAQASIYKIAVKTIPRCGLTSFFLLCIGLYFLFPTYNTFQQIQTEKNVSYELTASTNSKSIDLNHLIQIEGVERVSPVINLSSRVSFDENNLDCEIKAVYSSFLTVSFTQGTIYPDNSNMPYLVLNKAALKAFSRENQTVSTDDTVIIEANGINRKAIICGIFDDKCEVPSIYMSYDVAQKEYGTSTQTCLIFRLENKGIAERVASTLQRLNIYANVDSNLTLSWELLQKQGWQTMLLSIALLTCAAVLIYEKHVAELSKFRSETSMLLLSGLTFSHIRMIYPIRVGLTQGLCLSISTVVASIAKQFSFIGFTFGMCCSIIICLFVAAMPETEE